MSTQAEWTLAENQPPTRDLILLARIWAKTSRDLGDPVPEWVQRLADTPLSPLENINTRAS